MYQINFDPWTSIEFQRRHNELIKEAENHRLAKEALNNGAPASGNLYRFLALVGRALTVSGNNLVARYNTPAETNVGLGQQSDTSGCS